MNMEVSIIICTRNGAHRLPASLEAVGRLVVPPELPTELLVVDNGSTDRTAEVVEGIELANMPVRYVHEPRPGKGHAYNRGMAASRGDIFLFTDDDVRPRPGWIEGMCGPIQSGEADAVAGGVIFPADREAVLGQEPCCSRRGWFASTDDIDGSNPQRMVGANMAFGRQVLAGVPAFDPALGPGALGFFDETLFAWQLIEQGYRLVARLAVEVEHHFELSRLDRRGLLTMAERMGRSEAYVAWHWHQFAAPVTRRTMRRGWASLLGRRMLHAWSLAQGRTGAWELERVKMLAYYEQLEALADEPPRYARRRGEVAA